MPAQTIVACSQHVVELQAQQTAAKKLYHKCKDELVWFDSTRSPTQPYPGAKPSSFSPFTEDCSGGSVDSAQLKAGDAEIANNLALRGNLYFAEGQFAAAVKDYDDAYTLTHSKTIYAALHRARVALKASRNKH